MSRYVKRISEWKKEKTQIAEAKKDGKVFINFVWDFWVECDDGLYRCVDYPNKTITQEIIDHDFQHNTMRKVA